MDFFVWQRAIVDEQGNVLPSASVAVTDVVSGGMATLYSDEGTTTIGNPTTADADGFVRFYVKGGRYDIAATSGPLSREWENETLGINHRKTAAEATAGVTPTDYQYPPGDVRRYGENTTPGTTDTTTAINNCLLCNGFVRLQRETYLVTGLDLDSGYAILGGGEGTVIKIANAANQHVIRMAAVSDILIRDLAVDGNRANLSNSVHGIRLEDADRVTIENVEVKECRHYGIGAQGGTMTRIKFLNIDIHDVGGDGIDFKNMNDDNLDIHMANISVRQWGLAAAVQKGIDIRGPANLVNISVSEPGASDGIGVHFNSGELLDANGFGGHRSSMTGFDIRIGAAASGYGVRVGARDVSISNGYISGGTIGVRILDERFTASGVTVDGASNDGWNFDILSGDEGNNGVLIGCSAINCTDSGFVIETDNCQLLGCQAIDNDKGFVFVAGATGNRVIGGRSSNTTSEIVGLDSNNVLFGLNGFADEPVVSAAAVAAVGNTVNTANKYAGRKVWDSTNNRIMRASGAAAADPWYVIDGSASVTPA